MRRIDKDRLINEVKEFLKSNGNEVESIRFKRFLMDKGYSISYLPFIISNLKLLGVIDVIRTEGKWKIKLKVINNNN